MNDTSGSGLPEVIIRRLFSVRMTLRHVLYISYAVPAVRLQPFIPENLKLATVNGDTAFVSLVILRSTQVRLSTLPFIMFDYYQFNIRTYVIDPISGRNAVYFLRSGVTSRFISLATRSIGIPWEFIDLGIHITPLEGIKSSSISGNWEGKISLEAKAGSQAAEIPPLFKDMSSAVDLLIRPLIGFTGDKKRFGRFTIWHPEVQPESWSLVKLDCPIFRKLGLVEDYTNPHSVFYLPEADFSIYLPPTRIKG